MAEKAKKSAVMWWDLTDDIVGWGITSETPQPWPVDREIGKAGEKDTVRGASFFAIAGGSQQHQ